MGNYTGGLQLCSLYVERACKPAHFICFVYTFVNSIRELGAVILLVASSSSILCPSSREVMQSKILIDATFMTKTSSGTFLDENVVAGGLLG